MGKLAWIKSFIDIVEKGSLHGAAKKQGISTAAVSRQLASLETALHIDLIKRTTRQIVLTEVGALYYEQCKRVLDDLQEAENLLFGQEGEAKGKLRVMSSRYFAMNYLLPTLKKFLHDNPKIELQLDLAERFPNLAEEKIDILFGVSMDGDNELVRKRVATTRYVMCASSGYLKKYGTPIIPQDLIKHHYITHSMRKPLDVITFKHHQEVRVPVHLALNDSQAMRECALLGMGVVKLHDYMVNDLIARGRLVEVLKAYQEPQQYVYLYYQKSRYLQPKIRQFIDFYTSLK